MNDQHWLDRYHRMSSASYGKEAGWSETKGMTRLTATSWMVLGFVAATALVVMAVIYGGA